MYIYIYNDNKNFQFKKGNKFPVNLYYEPLSWFMIYKFKNLKRE